jgi:hypothetical protein
LCGKSHLGKKLERNNIDNALYPRGGHAGNPVPSFFPVGNVLNLPLR